MGKILAGIVAILIIWYGFPYFSRGLWISPTAIAPGTWMEQMAFPEHRALLAQPAEGYGMYHYDVWNNPSPYGQPIERLK